MSREEANRIGRAAERVRRSTRGSLKVLLPTAAALGAGAAVAIGQIPGSGGTITACYQNVPAGVNGADNQYGTLRVIDPSATTATDTHVYSCDPNTEQTITWNQQGPMGPQGQTGSQGQPGAPSTIVPETTYKISADRTYELFLKLDGVPEEKISMFELGAAGEVSATGKTTVTSFEIVKNGQDALTYALEHDFAAGQKIDAGSVTIERKVDGKETVVGVYDLRDIAVSSYQVGSNGQQPTESISFSYGQVKTSFGTGQSKLSTGWSSGKSMPGFNITQNQVS